MTSTVVCLHGDRKPKERSANLDAFKNKQVRFLICTDVAARGIDVKGVPYIINVTLPDEKSNYVHRIGRVGRAERMGLAISLVAAVPEKVWYHGEWCPSRGRGCSNTNLTDRKGCCIWYNEPQYLSDIEEHLGVTIQQVDTHIKVEPDEFDGKVVYGQKLKAIGSGYVGRSSQSAGHHSLTPRRSRDSVTGCIFEKILHESLISNNFESDEKSLSQSI